MKKLVEIDLTEKELRSLRWLGSLPTWIQDEFYERYSECNCDRLPIDEVKKLVDQIDRAKGKK